MSADKAIPLPAKDYTVTKKEDGTEIHCTTLRQMVKHCIGLDWKRPYHRHGRAFYRPYRNYFTTTVKDRSWDELVEAGYVSCYPEGDGKFVTYCLTPAGLEWLGRELDIHIYPEED